MKTTTNTANKASNIRTDLTWDTEQIFEANFMFPTPHFESVEELEALHNDAFCDKIISLLDAAQPLDSEESEALRKAVNSDNHLRVYYTTLTVLDRHLVADEKPCNYGEMVVPSEVGIDGLGEDEELDVGLGHEGFNIQTESDVLDLPDLDEELVENLKSLDEINLKIVTLKA